jgi:CelD/BcsL family acetyltransferase involved in cellulose biosynthesis
MNPLRAEVFSRTEQLIALESELWDLYDRVPNATPFQSPAWLLPWLQSFGPGELRALAVFSSHRLLAFLPLVLVQEGEQRVARVVGHGLSDYLDALIEPTLGPQASQLLLRALQEVMREVHRIDLTDVPQHSELPRLLREWFGGRLERCAVCPTLELGSSYVDYLATLPAWMNRNLKQTERRLAARGKLIFCQANRENLGYLLEAFFHLHALRWRAKDRAGVLHHASVREFHHQAAPRLLHRRALSLSVLMLDGAPIAAAYVLYRRDAHLYLTGFDPGLEKLSLGSLVIAGAIGQAIALGCEKFDFLRGEEAYKYSWGARDCFTTRLVWSSETRAAG